MTKRDKICNDAAFGFGVGGLVALTLGVMAYAFNPAASAACEQKMSEKKTCTSEEAAAREGRERKKTQLPVGLGLLATAALLRRR